MKILNDYKFLKQISIQTHNDTNIMQTKWYLIITTVKLMQLIAQNFCLIVLIMVIADSNLYEKRQAIWNHKKYSTIKYKSYYIFCLLFNYAFRAVL